MNYFTDVQDFFDKFDLTYEGLPRSLPHDVWKFRIKLMTEELFEYATAENNFEELDALVDLVYVAIGTACEHGFDFDEAWRRVHAANMRKVRARPDGSDSKRGSGHDVVKPAGWRPADLSDLV